MIDFEIPPGWLPHPDEPGWWYKGDRVKNEAQMRVKAANRAAHFDGQTRDAQAAGKRPPDKITSSQHPAVGDKAGPELMALMRAAQLAAEESLPLVLAAAITQHTAPTEAPSGSALNEEQIKRFTPEHKLRALAQSQMAMAIAQLAVIAADPLQLGPTRVSASVHLMERAVGKAQARLTPIDVDLSALSIVDAFAELSRIAASGSLSAEDVKAYAALIEGRRMTAPETEVAKEIAELRALLQARPTINQA